MKTNYLTNYLTKKRMKNVRYFQKRVITSQFLNYLTWCFVRKFLLYFSITYLITSHKIHTLYIPLKKGLKRGIYTGCEEINVRKLW